MTTIEESLWSKYSDGKRDATAYIQMMVSRSQGNVSFPHGTYLCKKTIKLD